MICWVRGGLDESFESPRFPRAAVRTVNLKSMIFNPTHSLDAKVELKTFKPQNSDMQGHV